MAWEIVRGRAVLDRDGYRLVPEAFDPAVLCALGSLGPISPVGESARARALVDVHGDETPRSRLRPSDGSEAGREAVSAALAIVGAKDAS